MVHPVQAVDFTVLFYFITTSSAIWNVHFFHWKTKQAKQYEHETDNEEKCYDISNDSEHTAKNKKIVTTYQLIMTWQTF